MPYGRHLHAAAPTSATEQRLPRLEALAWIKRRPASQTADDNLPPHLSDSIDKNTSGAIMHTGRSSATPTSPRRRPHHHLLYG
jgi:hypothetical protein